MTGTVEMWCIGCAGSRPFEPLECADGHGGDCPELACPGCGAAVLIAPWPDSDMPDSDMPGRDASTRPRDVPVAA